MRILNVFNFITLNGFFKGPGGDISFHAQGQEEDDYAIDAVNADNILLFGRVTYEMMSQFWPSEIALRNDAAMAERMNSAEKIVFSSTLKHAEWNNTRIISGDIVAAMLAMKKMEGKNMTVLGSGTIISLFADAGLIDSYELMLDPVAIGDGTTIFKGIKNTLNLELVSSRTFKSGIVLLSYKDVAKR